LQDASVQFLKPEIFTAEMKALQQHFVKKRDYVVERYDPFPICCACKLLICEGWMRWESRQLPQTRHFIFGLIVSFLEETMVADCVVSHLPEKIHTGLSFFEACLEEKVIIVPGKHLIPGCTWHIQACSSISIPKTAEIWATLLAITLSGTKSTYIPY